ncbi:hypothetical protein [Acuticoccus mangrovi]|uniref:Uncharacterized protein n=1 Tax=Acuticoccus mangrovi TaxID=2796142 RepID=A0A934MBM4_9HYPH|nr:hypothetical protein [Acuticoccus mangrovi]MBJ3774282.1 hypothetical protein [Acuticoccus mangrovi]
MLKSIFRAAAAIGALGLAPIAASAQTVDVLILQSDQDPNSLERGSQIQNGMLLEFQKVLNSPNVVSYMRQFGIEGMDVADEKAVILTNPGYDTTRTRRSDEELITLSRQIPGHSFDAIVLYTLYARAVPDPYTKISLLQASIQYRVLGRDGRFLGGDNMNLDTSGIPFTGCAAAVAGQQPDPYCVRQLVLDNVSRLAQDAANKIALQLAALVGRSAPAQPATTNAAIGGGGTSVPLTGSTGGACGNIPVTYIVSFEGVEGRQKNAIEEFMSSWACAMNLELQDDSLSTVSYRYKTTADRRRIVRNIRQMADMMGLIVETSLRGETEIAVETIGLRHN